MAIHISYRKPSEGPIFGLNFGAFSGYQTLLQDFLRKKKGIIFADVKCEVFERLSCNLFVSQQTIN